ACDAMSKLKILRENNECSFLDEELKVNISINKEQKTITIEDRGLGMNAYEVENFIAQLAFSGAEEFSKKYASQNAQDQIIGHFGLGFYSSFMVSKQVELTTLSYRENEPAVFWSSDGSYDYTLEATDKQERGTKITLHIDQDSEEFLEEQRLREILVKYCSFLPYPIFLGEEEINKNKPLWLKNPSECEEKDYLDFYHALYPMDQDPVFWIHLNVDYPFNLKGILFFPKFTKRFDYTKSQIQLYCNRVFVSDNCKDVIPEHLMMLKGVIDSPDIPLNVSRSALQMDRTVKQLSSHISKKVSDRLVTLHETNEKEFLEKWPDCELVIKWGILHDEKFYDRVKSCLVFKTTKGDYLTKEQYIERNSSKTNKNIYYLADEHPFKEVMKMFEEKEIDVLLAGSNIDIPLIQFLESKDKDHPFKRVDGGIETIFLNEESQEIQTKDETEKLFKSLLGIESLTVEAKNLASKELPGMIVVDEQSRRLYEYFLLSQGEVPAGFPKKHTFVVNTNHDAIQKIEKLALQDEALASKIAKQLYKLSLLAQKELKIEEMSDFVSESNELIHTILNKL
ncbi:MAG: molecular chaperone HtpG, partial [Chlamydiae bacterium]|nr:molecular chaperone HtpG [Chlamydiota bacterium]